MGFSWPGDKVPGRHTISYQQHQANLQGTPSNLGRGNLGLGGAAQFGGAATSPATDPGAGGQPEAPAAPIAPPVDPIYGRQVAQNFSDEQKTIGGLTGQRKRTLQEYGYTGDFDPVTNQLTGNLRFDPTDPYSRAAKMKDLYDARHVGTGLQRAGRGGLYSGSYQTAQDAVTRGQLVAEDTLQKSLLSYLEGVGTQIGEAKSRRGQGDINAATDAYLRSLNAT